MKEHATFIEGGFTPANRDRAQQAEDLKERFDSLLSETVRVANGVIEPDVLQSGEVVTQFTLNTERVTQCYTSIPIDTELTEKELCLQPDGCIKDVCGLECEVRDINCRAIALTEALIQFKTTLLNDILCCKIFTFNYPLLIDHILREARFFVLLLTRLQTNTGSVDDIVEQEIFWNRIMSEHAFFIRGLLDPTECELLNTANRFGMEFNTLFEQAKSANCSIADLARVTLESQKATQAIREFKTTATEGLLDCKIKSIILPLLSDHVLREANHYQRLLNMCEASVDCCER